ncbi:unnamed protein product, partial [marine sediment metagenome]
YIYYATVDVYDPAGKHKAAYWKEIVKTFDGGQITIDNNTIMNLLPELGPGISTIKVQVAETEYFKASPIVNIPLEVRPPNWARFGEKNTQLDLIDPFINAWGNAFDGEEYMPFESNYPHLMGTIWVEPDFMGPVDEKEQSIQDYIEINLMCEAINDEGETSTFPLREGIMLRPGNRDGIMKFDIGLGPEDAFLMGTVCKLNLSFDINYNAFDIYEDNREVEIYLLDLRLEENPSSNTSNTLWSYYNNQFDVNLPPNFAIDYYPTAGIQPQTSLVSLGGIENGVNYGIEVDFIYEP